MTVHDADPSLLGRCQCGDGLARPELFDNYVRSVCRWVQEFGIDKAGAAEVGREVFAVAFRRITQSESDSQLWAGLFQIARRHAAGIRRSS